MPRQIRDIIPFFTLAMGLILSPCAAQVSPLKTENLRQTLEESVIKNRAISSRCQLLNQQRKDKMQHKQKLSALQSRTERLLKVVASASGENLKRDPKDVQRRLDQLKTRIHHELKLTEKKIIHREQHLVRTGCPTIRF